MNQLNKRLKNIHVYSGCKRDRNELISTEFKPNKKSLVVIKKNNNRKRGRDELIITGYYKKRSIVVKRDAPQIIYECVLGTIDGVSAILRKTPFDINSTECTGRTPLMFAVILGKYRLVERLLEEDNIDINIVDNDDNTALDYAYNCFQMRPNRMLTLTALQYYIENGCKSHNKIFISI